MNRIAVPTLLSVTHWRIPTRSSSSPTTRIATSPYRNGFGHIALGVPDVYKPCDELRAKGAKIVREPGPMKGGSGSNAIAFVEDPTATKSN